MGKRGSLLLILQAALLITTAHALYEDQLGAFDWYKQLVGEVDGASLVPGKGRVYVASRRQNLLAALDGRDGSIAWRRTFTEADPLAAHTVLAKPGVIVTASRGGKYVRAWDVEGNLKWEVVLLAGLQPAQLAPHTLALAATSADGAAQQSLVVAAGDKLAVIDTSKGAVSWAAELPGAAGAARLLHLHDQVVAVTYWAPGSREAQIRAFSLADGSPVDDAAPSPAMPLGTQAAASGKCAAVLSADGGSLCAACHGAQQFGCTELEQLQPGFGAAAEVVAAGPDMVAVASAGTGVALLSPSNSGARLTQFWAGATAVSAAAGGQLAVATATSAGVSIQLVDAQTGASSQTLSVSLPEPAYPVHGSAARPVRAFLAAGGSKGKPAAPQVLLMWSDGQLTLSSGSALQWSRDESLASVRSAAFVELPGARGAASESGMGGGSGGLLGFLQGDNFKAFVRLQQLSVGIQFGLASAADREEFLQLRSQLSDKHLPYRDANGHRKIILVLTSAGRLAALHNGDGRILWARQFDPAVAPNLLLSWRTFHDLTHAPEVLVLRTGAEDAAAAVINAHTGVEVATIQLPFAVQKVVPLHQPLHDGQAEQAAFLLVGPAAQGGAPQARLLPDTPAARQAFQPRLRSTFFWLASPAGKQLTQLTGYGFEAASAAADGSITPLEVWRLQLPGELLALAARDPSEPMHTHIKVLGDRSVKHKYANPNLLLVATGSPSLPPGDSPEDAVVTVHLLDSVTGAVLHRQLHEQCSGPVRAVVSEHWAVYTVQSLDTLRTQVTSIELYDASPRRLSVDQLLMDTISGGSASAGSNEPLSSFAPPALQVLTQSFWLQHGVKGIGVTRTRRGITSKQLLLSTAADRVYALDKRFLDPRRPMRAKQTPEDVEEQLMPYQDNLPFVPQGHVTLHRQVAGLSGVLAGPADLESTCLVFAWGTDLFYTRLVPARHFDSLDADFSYGLLVVGLVVLAGLTLAARAYSSRATVKAKWQ